VTVQGATLVNSAVHGAPPQGVGVLRHGRAFLSWWLEELAGLLPGALRARFSGAGAQAGIVLEGDTLRLTDLRGGQIRPLCEFDLSRMSPVEAREAVARALGKAGLADCPVVLGLPEHAVLRYRESLPAGAERRLADILRLKLESTAPLPPGNYHWAYRITGPASGGRLPVECVLVKSETLEALNSRMAGLGIGLSGIYPAADLPGEPSLNLLPAHLRRERLTLWSPLNKGLGALAVVLFLLALVLSFHKQDSRLEALNAELAVLKDQAASVLALRTEALDYVQNLQAVQAAKAAAPPLMGILDETSRLLPDGTWVSDFRMSGGEVRIAGQSQSASSLIGLLENSPLFTNVRFASPVVRDPRSGTERFNISFEWVSTAAAPASAAREGGGR
jgi:general secretion pathway protein L